jgi:insertion element IS1 protein InsB
MIPAKQLVQSKAETYTVESYNGVIRHFLARFRVTELVRKTKMFSKCEKIISFRHQ